MHKSEQLVVIIVVLVGIHNATGHAEQDVKIYKSLEIKISVTRLDC